MKDGIGDQTPVARKEAFDNYLNYYEQIWSKGNLKLCQEKQVTVGARRFLLLETDPGERFSNLDFYLTAFECVKSGFKDCRAFFSALIKATEVLEMFCVNLFLYPWKKEIKILKTFTGHFVYCIQPVLTKSTTKSILETIGYHLETDTEYRLADNADPETAMKMGFELFLARTECEYLLELMGQRSQPECLEILQRRAAPLHNTQAAEETAKDSETEPSQMQKQEENEDKGLSNGCSLVDPGPVETDEGDLTEENRVTASTPGRQQDGQITLNLEVQSIETTHSPGIRPPRAFLNDDRSILEMQQNYPDLAIRQKPIFSKPLGGPPVVRRRLIKENTPEEGSSPANLAGSDVSGLQLISLHATAAPKPHLTEAVPKLQPPEDKAYETTATIHGPTPPQVEVTREGQEADDADELSKLAESIGQLHVHEHKVENLKYPVEETALPHASCHDGSPHQDSAGYQSLPLMCHSSLVPVCNIPVCSSCEVADSPHKHVPGRDTIKEPPHTIYVPTSHLDPPVLDPTAADRQPSAGPQHQDMEGPIIQPSEDELLQTYVMVDGP
ncbi:spermatogenesis-associated protein 2-like [Oncorhynchus keta]|uniref:spermatogenesis-associated protein 2-like n=1 Tax=Oncorhynchus keta TaxID=8018 RepID=UPI0015F87A65|nr:spermatogenesis-associated protein 2-like [Oncorhynchus keta]